MSELQKVIKINLAQNDSYTLTGSSARLFLIYYGYSKASFGAYAWVAGKFLLQIITPTGSDPLIFADSGNYLTITTTASTSTRITII